MKTPDSLDALATASAYHTLLLENDETRVLMTRIPAGHTTPVHTHCWPAVIVILSWSDFVRRNAEGKITLDTTTQSAPSRESAFYSDPFPPHSVENVGSSELRTISVEFKR